MTDIDLSAIDHRVRKVLQATLLLNAAGADVARMRRADELLGLDSIATIEFVLALEQEFGITLDPETLDPTVFADLTRLAGHIAERLRRR